MITQALGAPGASWLAETEYMGPLTTRGQLAVRTSTAAQQAINRQVYTHPGCPTHSAAREIVSSYHKRLVVPLYSPTLRRHPLLTSTKPMAHTGKGENADSRLASHTGCAGILAPEAFKPRQHRNLCPPMDLPAAAFYILVSSLVFFAVYLGSGMATTSGLVFRVHAMSARPIKQQLPRGLMIPATPSMIALLPTPVRS